MLNLQERTQELVNERNQLITRINEINGVLKEFDQIAKAVAEETEKNPTEEENDG